MHIVGIILWCIMIRVGIHVKTQEVMVLMNMMNIWMMKVQEKFVLVNKKEMHHVVIKNRINNLEGQ